MIRLKESTILASKKFSAKKGRSIFSGCTIALGVILIAMLLMGTKGVFDVLQKNFKDTLADAPYTMEIQYGCTSTPEFPCDNKPINPEEWKNQYKDFNIQEMKELKANSDAKYGITAFSESEELLTVSELDEFFVKDFLYGDYSFEDKYDGKIPVIIPKNYVLDNEFDAKDLSEKDKFLKSQDALNKYLGKSFKLLQKNESKTNEVKEIEIVIVGYGYTILGYDTIGNLSNNSIIFPTWAKEKNSKLNTFLSDGFSKIFLLKFADRKAASNYYEKRVVEAFGSQNITINQVPEEINSRFFFLQEILKVVRGMGIALGVIMLVISSLFAFSTISKIVDDSKKEIGIFRAFGAVKNDVRKIYFIYTFLLSNLGFFMGFGIALIVNFIISIIWGENLFYSLVNFGNNLDVTKPLLMFVSIPFTELLVLYIAILVLGILSALIPVWRASSIEPISVIRDE